VNSPRFRDQWVRLARRGRNHSGGRYHLARWRLAIGRNRTMARLRWKPPWVLPKRVWPREATPLLSPARWPPSVRFFELTRLIVLTAAGRLTSFVQIRRDLGLFARAHPPETLLRGSNSFVFCVFERHWVCFAFLRAVLLGAGSCPGSVGWVRSVRAEGTGQRNWLCFVNSAKRPDWARSVLMVENRIRLWLAHLAPE